MTTLKERPITISGETAVLQPWIHSNKEQRINHSLSISMISNAIADCEKNGKPKIIGIEGRIGTGKTVLAKVLNNNARRCQLIDVCSLIDYSSFSYELPVLDNSVSTFIIDEADLVQAKSLLGLIENTIENNGVLVLLFQAGSDFDEVIKKALKDMKFFKLTRDGLALVEKPSQGSHYDSNVNQTTGES